MSTQRSPSKKGSFAPAITLMLMAPLLTEILPGATRFSSIFVLPIEMCVWGIGALLIREAVRRYKLGWQGMILLGLALAIAEECLLQQTSLAPLVIHLKGQTYARAFGLNYVYFLWAMIYEPVFVVVLSISVVETIFPSRKQMQWISKGGLFVLLPLLLIGSLLAWYSWTQIARVKFFHLPPYHPPVPAILLSLAAMGILIYTAFKKRQPSGKSFHPLSSWLLGVLGAAWAFILFGLVLLGLGIDPAFPEWIAVTGPIIILVLIPIQILPKFARHPGWDIKHQFGLTCGTIIGSMAAGQIGFIGTTGPDLYFKIVTNVLAVFLLILLGIRINKQTTTHAEIE
jgi:hypothetical protein